MRQSTHVFISCSHEDEAWCEALAEHLGSLQDPFGVPAALWRMRMERSRELRPLL